MNTQKFKIVIALVMSFVMVGFFLPSMSVSAEYVDITYGLDDTLYYEDSLSDDVLFMVGIHPLARTIRAETMDEDAKSIQVPESLWDIEAIQEASSLLVGFDMERFEARLQLDSIDSDSDFSDISPHLIIGSDNRTRVTNTALIPYRSIVEIASFWPNGSMSWGSGFFGNRSDAVITNAHVLYSPDMGGWATGVTVFTERNGSFHGGWLWVGGSWFQNGHRDGDFGLIQLHQDAGASSLQLLALNDAGLNGLSVTVTGFPWDKNHTMWRGPGRIREVWRHRFLHDCATLRGTSGAPVYNSRNQVVGINRGHVTRNEWDTTPITPMNDAIKIERSFIDWLRSVN